MRAVHPGAPELWLRDPLEAINGFFRKKKPVFVNNRLGEWRVSKSPGSEFFVGAGRLGRYSRQEGDVMPSRTDNLTVQETSSQQMMMPRAWCVGGSGIML
jgi:hypothetical protein